MMEVVITAKLGCFQVISTKGNDGGVGLGPVNSRWMLSLLH
jgi:hypothetical protein